MLGHTRRHHTSNNIPDIRIPIPIERPVEVDRPLSVSDKPMSVNDVLQELYGELPRWAIVLRGLRHREGLTQAQIGKLLGIPQGNISQMEHGTRPIGKLIAKRLADLFKTDYRLFL